MREEFVDVAARSLDLTRDQLERGHALYERRGDVELVHADAQSLLSQRG